MLNTCKEYIYKEISEPISINDIEIDKIRVSGKRLYIKRTVHTSITFFMKMIMNTFL